MCVVSIRIPGPIVDDTVTLLRYLPLAADGFALTMLYTSAWADRKSVVRAKPSAAKGKYLRSITVSSTMGPGVKIDEAGVEASAKK